VDHPPIRLAVPQDATAIFALRGQLEDWLASRAVVQWEPGEVALDNIVAQVKDGEWHVAAEGESLLGALRLLWADEPVWREEDRFAAYVHGLMVPRCRAGNGLGAALLSWAERQAQWKNAPSLRLDCVEANLRLREYYASLGFREVGRRDFDGPWYSATLFEKTPAVLLAAGVPLG